MKITFIHHSCFLAELDSVSLLFDYTEGELPPVQKNKPLLVFASHRHGDHYSPEIFRLAQGHEAIRWILSFDIWRKRLPHEVWPFADSLKYNQQLSYQVKGGKVIPASEDQSNIKVRAFRSTDEGVAFLIEADGKVLYHGGDLNHWYWEGEDQNWNRSMGEKYTRQIERLAETLAERSVDAAFLPLDPRQEDAFYLGFHEFMEKIKVRFAFPMHCWGDFSVIERLKSMECSAEYRDRVIEIVKDGDAFVESFDGSAMVKVIGGSR